MNWVSLPVRRPVATTMFFTAIVIMGVVAWSTIPVELFPPLSGDRLFVIHGTDDTSVPLQDGRDLAAASGTTLLEIEGAGHTFGAVHPFAGPTADLEAVAGAVIDFFGRRVV